MYALNSIIQEMYKSAFNIDKVPNINNSKKLIKCKTIKILKKNTTQQEAQTNLEILQFSDDKIKNINTTNSLKTLEQKVSKPKRKNRAASLDFTVEDAIVSHNRRIRMKRGHDINIIDYSKSNEDKNNRDACCLGPEGLCLLI
jgi:hypothetical protein